MTLRELRQKKDMSQTELASEVGVSKSTISMLEAKVRKPSLATVKKLAEVLQVDVKEILECF